MFYLLWYRYNLKKAIKLSKNAIVPVKPEEYAKILIPAEWKEMQPLTKQSRAYLLVKWGTVAVVVIFSVLFGFALVTDWLDTAYLNLIYLFCMATSIIHHPGNFYLLQNGIVLNGRYYSFNQVKRYQVEQIIRWHDLYGLDSRVNNSYKLTLKINNWTNQPNFIVVEDDELLNKMVRVLQHHHINGSEIQQAK